MKPLATDLDFLRLRLQKAGIEPSRSSGQNFLISPEVIEAAIEAISNGPKNVTELGAGPGALTQALASNGYIVRTIERDRVLADILLDVIEPKFRDHITIIRDDLRNVGWGWKEPYQVVGNIPYNISGLILRGLTQLNPAPTQALLLVQKEVAERITETAPDMSLVGLSIQLWGSAQKVLNVPPGCFWPSPKVYSALVFFTPFTGKDALPVEKKEAILQIAKRCFQGKRKQLVVTLPLATNLDRTTIEFILNSLNILPTKRPQELTPADWINLYDEIQKQPSQS